MKNKVTVRVVGSQNKEDWYFGKVNQEFECTFDVVSGNWKVLQSNSPDPKQVHFIAVEDGFVVKKERKRKHNLIGSYKAKK